MKKTLLFGVSLLFAFYNNAQNNNTPLKTLSLPASIANQAVRTGIHENVSEPIQLFSATSVAAKKALPINQTVNGAATQIGYTAYQLQTNSSNRNGLFKNADGTVSAVWNYSPSDPATDRGTGYAYFNGTSWAASPSVRLETTRTGWPSIVVTSSGGEVIINHNTAKDNLELITRPAKGTGNWTEFVDPSKLPGPSLGGNVWPRIAVGGPSNNTLHVISLTAPTSLGGVKYNNQNGALTYSRSLDGGVTWDKINQPSVLTDSLAGFNHIEPDSYAIDANGSTVAYVTGNRMADLVLIKSTDNGDSWSKKTVLKFPYKNWNGEAIDVNNDLIPDTINTTDGSYAVLIDNNNLVHVWYGNMRVNNPTANDSGSFFYFPSTAGLMYWNENMPTDSAKMIAGLIDYDNSGIIELPNPPTGGRPYGIYYKSLTSQPQAGIDVAGNIYVAYSAVIENTVDKTGSKALRNIMLMGLPAGSSTWTGPVFAEQDAYFEQVYPSVARHVNSCISVMYQGDEAAGHGVSSGTTAQEDKVANTGVLADIIYKCVDVTEVIPVGIKENTSDFSAISNYPNPFSGKTFISVTLKKPSDVSVDVTNTMGQKVLTIANNSLQSGTQTITVDASSLKAGIYFYTLKTKDASVTNKFIVQ